MKRRLLHGMGANAYAQGVTALIQLASVPLLLRAWGPEGYGRWTLLAALPSALAFVDGGLLLATGNAMAMATGKGDLARAAALLRLVERRVRLMVLGAAAIVALVVVLLPRFWTFPGFIGAETALTSLALVTLLGVYAGVSGAAFRAGGQYAFGVALGATIRFAEAAAVCAAALSGLGLGGAAAAWLATRGAGTGLQIALLKHRVAWMAQSAAAVPAVQQGLWRHGLAALALPAAFAVSLQGVTVALGLALSPELVASFVAARTLARVIVQASGLVNHAVMPELSFAVGRSDRAAIAGILRVNTGAILALLLPGWLLLLTFGPHLLEAWTGGRLPLAAAALPLIATAALLHGLWLSRANLLLSVNRQADYAWMFLAVSLVTALAAGLAAARLGLSGAAAATLLSEALMLAWILHVERVAPLTATVALGAVP